MEPIITGTRADLVFDFFEQIAKIPHGSQNEKGIADFIEHFAAERGLACYRDAANNVLIRKNGTAGREAEPVFALQGHTDMVCEKEPDVEHDFEKDSLKLRVLDGYLCATGTTLGADNGIAVAMMLAILDGGVDSHPPLECLFTAGEEIGMIGAGQFDFSKLTAKRLLNMDSESEHTVIAGCAGGVRSEIALDGTRRACDCEGISLTVSGLHGGHSGEDISKGRANANRLMGRLLLRFLSDPSFRLVLVSGGSQDNAIPRDCRAVFAVNDVEHALAEVREMIPKIAAELSDEDKHFTCTAEKVAVTEAFDPAFSRAFTAMMNFADNGVYAMSTDIAGLVEWSGNMGVVQVNEKGGRLVFLSRSSTESRIDESIARIDALAALYGAKTSHHGRYPGWRFRAESPLRDRFIEVSKRLHGFDIQTTVIHAGLECGLIYRECPDMDIISAGPDMEDIHSPAERLHIASAERFWLTVLEMLK